MTWEIYIIRRSRLMTKVNIGRFRGRWRRTPPPLLGKSSFVLTYNFRHARYACIQKWQQIGRALPMGISSICDWSSLNRGCKWHEYPYKNPNWQFALLFNVASNVDIYSKKKLISWISFVGSEKNNPSNFLLS